MTATEVNIGNCRICEFALNDTSAVLLWDGRQYCRGCLEHAAPGLADYARDNPVLQEARPLEVNAQLQTYWRFIRPFLLSATFGCMAHVVLSGWKGGDDWILKALSAFLFLSLLAVFIVTYICMKPFRKAKAGMPRVTVSAGVVQLYHGNELVHTAMLADCSWSDLSKNQHSNPESDVIYNYLLLTWRRWWSTGEPGVLCGFTAEMRTRWVQFLMVAEVRDSWARAKKPKP